ncbi:MAG: hypothetical protein HY067_00010 [Betaproteobacteria bacterium]|nr:hypothetical protein [Betaproteobacteria bacterium]
MRKNAILSTFSLAIMALSMTACTHALEVKNLDLYAASVHLVQIEPPVKVAVLPYEGSPDGQFYFNTLVERLSRRPGIAKLQTDYIVNQPNEFNPDVILSINPTVKYRSSGWNFLINFPGFIIFTPAWNGYVYHADIMTDISINDKNGTELSSTKIPISYSIREAEMDRTIWTGLTWLEVGILAFGGGIYNANVFDRDIIGTLEYYVRDNYATFISNEMQPKIRAAQNVLRARGSTSESGQAEKSSSPSTESSPPPSTNASSSTPPTTSEEAKSPAP